VALLSVHLDVDEEHVHQGGRAFVLEALPLHDMAPVARGVADAQEDGLVLLRSTPQSLGSPWIPVHWVVGVLQEVGAVV
jgi:hypothetical protein